MLLRVLPVYFAAHSDEPGVRLFLILAVWRIVEPERPETCLLFRAGSER